MIQMKQETEKQAGLTETEQAVFEVIAINPDTTIKRIREKYGLTQSRVMEITDNLQHKNYIQQLQEHQHNDCLWKITEIGRLKLLEYTETTRFEIMEAKLREKPENTVEKLEDKKEAFETAYRQSKMLFEGENQ